jgi:hypothetical protein
LFFPSIRKRSKLFAGLVRFFFAATWAQAQVAGLYLIRHLAKGQMATLIPYLDYKRGLRPSTTF